MISIPGYKQGDDITLLDTYYVYPKRIENENGSSTYTKDYISILYKDNKTGKKDHYVIINPEYEFYKLLPEIPIPSYNKLFVPKEEVYPISTPYTNLLKRIAEETNNLEFFYSNLQAGNSRANKILHFEPDIFNSDMNIDDHYRFQFDKTYSNQLINVDKAFFDIEVDTLHMKGDFPELGECPINAVSYIYENKIRSFLLRNDKNNLIDEFENELKSDHKKLFKELNDFIIENVGGIERAKKFKLDNLEYEFIFYDEEICLIHDLFAIINKDEPDFLLAWNMAFDVPYIIERIIALGYDPKDFMCHPDFDDEHREAKYYIDERHLNEYAERGDRYTISANTVYLDQLIHFASRRKGQAAFPDFKLDTAGSIIADVKKLDYSNITTQISMLPYLNFKVFVFYNIMDTIVQKCIEEEVKDIDYVFGKCLMNNTRYDKCHRQTVYLTNRATKEWYNKGYIIGNNTVDGKSYKFKAALVHDPTNNSDFMKLRIGNQVINVADNLNDFDFKSLYPSTAREHNMAPNTQIGKIVIDKEIHRYENPFGDPMYDRGGQFVEDLTSQNIITFCERWMNYPTFREWLDDLEYYYTNIKYPLFELGKESYTDMIVGRCKKGLPIPLVEKATDLKGKPINLVENIPEKINYDKYIDIVKSGVF